MSRIVRHDLGATHLNGLAAADEHRDAFEIGVIDGLRQHVVIGHHPTAVADHESGAAKIAGRAPRGLVGAHGDNRGAHLVDGVREAGGFDRTQHHGQYRRQAKPHGRPARKIYHRPCHRPSSAKPSQACLIYSSVDTVESKCHSHR